MADTPLPIETLLFAQHGWADNNQAMQRFGETVAPPGSLVIAPNLGYVRTWLRIEPLIEIAEHEAARALAEYPDARIRVVGHSMGGLIWIELLTRHPDWLARTDRLALVGCPVGGAVLAGLLDPLGLTIGRDLKVDRREKAEAIAAAVPTLTIVGDLLGPHDGTVSHESARVPHARFVLTPSASHASLRHSPLVARLVRAFFEEPNPPSTDLDALVAGIQAVPGDSSDRLTPATHGARRADARGRLDGPHAERHPRPRAGVRHGRRGALRLRRDRARTEPRGAAAGAGRGPRAARPCAARSLATDPVSTEHPLPYRGAGPPYKRPGSRSLP